MVYYSALHWAKKAEKSAEKCEQIQEDLDASGLDLSKYAKKSEVVHRTGDETIDGIKTFNNGVFFNSPVSFVKNTTNTVATYQDVNYVRDKSLETNNIPYNKTYYTNALMDKNNKFVTYIQNVHKADGASSISINARTQNANGENVTSSIGVEATKNGDVVATAPIPTASNSMDSKRITTIGWVNDPSASLNVVHRTGDEDINGKKRFKSSQGALYARFTGSDSMTAPSSELYNAAIMCEDKNGKNTGNFRNIFSTNGNITTDMQVCREINGTAKFANMGIRMSNTGVVSTTAPTPPTGDNSTQIATTEWFNSKHKVVSALPSSPTAGVFYYITE